METMVKMVQRYSGSRIGGRIMGKRYAAGRKIRARLAARIKASSQWKSKAYRGQNETGETK